MEFQEIFSDQEIGSRVRELGRKISEDYRGDSVVAVCVLKGAFVFFSDLVRHIDDQVDLQVDFVRLASYSDQTSRSGRMVFSKDMEIDIKDRNVLIIEDIVDTGHSMQYLRKVLAARGPKSIRIAAMVDKTERREVHDVTVDYPGFALSEGFIVGYGLDYAERYRNRAGIFDLKMD
ncbi:MAG TPA: hypoxanthine phosphoribosyltransferase [Desulfomicrobiaceae bacterium]|nr:hypoxanthine phosphoribosyltransferase [Desulfomicrobiaceae bacterium]